MERLPGRIAYFTFIPHFRKLKELYMLSLKNPLRISYSGITPVSQMERLRLEKKRQPPRGGGITWCVHDTG